MLLLQNDNLELKNRTIYIHSKSPNAETHIKGSFKKQGKDNLFTKLTKNFKLINNKKFYL